MRRPGWATLALLLAVLCSPSAPAASAPPGADRRPPSSGFTQTDVPVRVGAPLPSDLALVQGWARDDRSGVDRVTVFFCPGTRHQDGSWVCTSELSPVSTPFQVRAEVVCRAGSRRRDCQWRTPAPERPGRYLVLVRAQDRSGRSATSPEVFEVLVL
ncbi:hypothetical protein [Nocardioides sp.]|uniref:hypothetical protein n=1 Tax=Nocardioides sp. TaxID=35761 RepID=UPI00356AA584